MYTWIQAYSKNSTYPKHQQSHKSGGIHMNQEESANFLQVAGAILKQIASRLAKGEFNIATIPKPLIISSPITMSECLMQQKFYFKSELSDFSYSQTYLNAASMCPDPVMRMRLIACNLIGSIHKSHSLLKSLAPIDCQLGETVQRVCTDGTRFYSEFIRQEPPTTLFQVYGPNNDWMVHGTEEVRAQVNVTLTQIVGKNHRSRFLKFKDGIQYEISVPTMIVDGLLTSNRVLNKCGVVKIKCPQQKLVCLIEFSYTKDGWKVMKLFSNKKQQTDLVNVKIYKLVNNQDSDDFEDACVLSEGTGSWLSHLQFDNQLYWRITDDQNSFALDDEILMSDSMRRVDKQLMMEGKLDEAEKHRNSLEDQHNRDKQNRRNNKKNIITKK